MYSSLVPTGEGALFVLEGALGGAGGLLQAGDGGFQVPHFRRVAAQVEIESKV